MKRIILLLILAMIILYYYNCEQFENTNEYILPKKIFAFWDSGVNKNKIISSHIETWKRNIPSGWEINIVTDDNLHEYVSEEFLEKYKDLNVIRFSDFLRLELLKNYGGVWIDAGIIITNGKFLDEYRNEMIRKSLDVTLYELIEKSNSKNNPYLENWFIMAPKNSKFIYDLYEEFDKSYQMDFINYKDDILIPSGVNLEGTLGYEDRTYLMQHAIINYLIHIGKKYKINIKDSYESMFKIHNMMKWDHEKIIEYIMNNKNWNEYYAIKLASNQRQYIKNIDKYVQNIRLI
jgi:hypothetical protein